MPETIDEQLAWLRRGTAEIVTEDGLRAKLKQAADEGRPLRIKLGCDPTAPDMHLGHAVVLRKMRQFQDLGHQVLFIIGDATGRIGDPSGKNLTRPQLTDEEVAANAETYKRQVYGILDPERTQVLFNNDWLGRLDLKDLVRLASSYTVARMLERDDFEARYKSGRPISVHEFLYPLVQAYDSVYTRADVELGGTDQKFNLVMARDVQREYGQDPQVAVLTPLLEGTDGVEKMSKSLANYIGITEPAAAMFGKIMSVPDDLIERYFELCTEVPMAEIRSLTAAMAAGRVNPRDVKARLGREITAIYHDERAARAAEEEFTRVFRGGQIPADIPDIALPPEWLARGAVSVIDLLEHSGLVSSRSEARRLVRQGAVSLDGAAVVEGAADVALVPGLILKVGKRRFARLTAPDGSTAAFPNRD
ncbi:MAG: tyrosine--tRNA ligase [Thermaerobacterales bacterium]